MSGPGMRDTGQRTRTLHCVARRDETADVTTFTFRTTDGQPVRFTAGQAMTLALDVDGERLLRTFSLSSAPCREEGGEGTVEITIKAHPAGRATSWLHRTVMPGSVLEAFEPRGRFVLGTAPLTRIALLSAGSGVTPLLSMLRHLAGTAPETDIVWFHAARTPADVLFGAELARLQRRMPHLAVAISVSRAEPGWFGYRGRICRRLLSAAVPDLGRRDAFCCGPSGFMTEARLIHAAEGGAAARFHIENFQPVTEITPAPEGIAPVSDAQFTITLDGKSFNAAAGETILQAATRQTVVIPCGCASGICGTCRVRKLEGTVAMRHNGGLSDEEENEGFILACSSRPLSDVTISY